MEELTSDAGVVGLLAALRTAGGSVTVFVLAKPLIIGCKDPFGSRKQAVSGAGRAGAASTLAPRMREYGTMRIGLVGNAKHGCGGGESPGLELVGGEALAEEDAPVVAGGGGGGAPSLTTCLVLQ